MKYSIFSLNICLGIFNKLDELNLWLLDLKPDICFIQECELTKENLPFIKIKDYTIVTTKIANKSRLCAFVRSKLLSVLKCTISPNTETILVEDTETQIVGFYRPFKLQKHNTSIHYIEDSVNFLKENLTQDKKIIIIGDFNLDYNFVTISGYAHRKIYDIWLSFTDEFGLVQSVNNPTWTRNILGQQKSSILDHCYSNFVTQPLFYDTLLSDHLGLFIQSDKLKQRGEFSSSYKRSWKSYSKQRLTDTLLASCWERFKHMSIEQSSDFLEIEIMSALNKIAPEKIILPKNRKFAWSDKLLEIKRRKQNLMKKKKIPNLKKCLKSLDKLFRKTIVDERREKIRANISLNNPNSLWDAIKVADDKYGRDEIPNNLKIGENTPPTQNNKAQIFADFFREKIETLKSKEKDSNPTPFDGKMLIEQTSFEPFNQDKIDLAFNQTKRKNSFGFDRVPMRVLLDSYDVTRKTIFELFNKIASTSIFPSKWKYGRVVPLFKKGDIRDVSNYRPISNICSLAKIFERCLLNELRRIEELNQIKLSGAQQHGFQQGKSCITLGLDLQNEIADALQLNEKIGLVSLDLTAAFDTICHDKLVLRLTNMGLPLLFVDLIKSWLSERFSYIDCDGQVSMPYEERWGTPQGSVLGPTLFSLYMRPLFDVVPELRMYADDNYIIDRSSSSEDVLQNLESKIQLAHKWLKDSELYVNLKKTEFVVFENSGSKVYKIKVFGEEIQSKNTINVLGVLFDKNLRWADHIDKVVNNAKTDCFRIRKLRPYFNADEMAKIITSLVFTKFYYGAVIWLNPFVLKSNLNRLLSASTFLIKNAFYLSDWKFVNRYDIHLLANRATPKMMSNYISASSLANILSNEFPSKIYVELNENYLQNSRTGLTYFPDKSRKRVGLNKFANRLSFVSKNLPKNWSNLSIPQFKKLCKTEFLCF